MWVFVGFPLLYILFVAQIFIKHSNFGIVVKAPSEMVINSVTTYVAGETNHKTVLRIIKTITVPCVQFFIPTALAHEVAGTVKVYRILIIPNVWNAGNVRRVAVTCVKFHSSMFLY